jgi:hypothetical protein
MTDGFRKPEAGKYRLVPYLLARVNDEASPAKL